MQTEATAKSGFRVGLGDLIVNSRYSPTAFARADYLTATASGIDSVWLGDHLNSLYPRSVATPQVPGRRKANTEGRGHNATDDVQHDEQCGSTDKRRREQTRDSGQDQSSPTHRCPRWRARA